MAETLRDLVVSLSLNSDNFNANIKSLNAQLKEADSAFKAASAGVTGYENTVAGAEAKLASLQQKFQLQQQAVQQYEKALQQAEQKLQSSVDAHEKLSGKLEEAKQKHSELGQEIERLTGELNAAQEAGLEGTAAYQEMQAQLEALQQQYAESGEEIGRMEQQLQRSERAMQRNADGVTRASTNLNNARAALSETGAQISETSSRLERMRSAWSTAADHIAAFGEKAVAAGHKIEDAGKKLSKLSAVATAAGAAAVKTFASYDDAIRQVYATMGLSAEENQQQMDALSAAAQEMGASTRYSASEAASALNYLALAGYDADQAIEALPTVLRLAQAGGIDLASASDMVTDSMSALGISMEDMPKFADQMAKASQKANTSVAQLGEGILKIGGTAANLKGGTVELNTALGILADNGIKGAEGGTHLRNVLLSLQNPTKDATAQLDAFGVKAYDAEGNMRGLEEIFGDLDKAMAGMSQQAKDAALSAIFNKTDLTAVNALLANSGQRWRELSGEIANAEGTAEAMADTMEGGIGGAFRSLKSAVEGLAIAFGETLAPVVQAVADRITEYVRKFTEMDDAHKKTVVTIGAVVAAAGPVLVIVGKVVTAVGKLAIGISKGMKAIAGAKTAIGGLAGGLSLGTAGVAAFATAAAVGVYKLLDWASGAKAAREAQARLNESVKEWNENVTTAYENSKGLGAFGLSADDFKIGGSGADSATGWLDAAIATWTDGKKETDEIVAETVKGFTDGTEEIRSALQGLQESGGGGMLGDLDGDLERLDAMDAEVDALFKKRQNGFLTEDEIARLQSLIEQRDAIKIKYQLVSDTDGAFDQITESVEAAMSRGADGGKVWADSYAAATQGLQAFEDSLNAEYDARYKNIQAMEEGAEKEQALSDLQKWHAEQAAAAQEKYAQTLSQTAEQTGIFAEGGQYDETLVKLGEVNAAIEQLGQATSNEEKAAALDSLNTAMQGMDEASLTEATAALVSMSAAGAELTPEMESALAAISAIKESLSGGEDLFGDSFSTLNELFGEGLDAEVLEINATLNTQTLDETYTAWAAGEHADIIATMDPSAAEAQAISLQGNITEILPASGVTFSIDASGNITEIGWPEGSEYQVDARGNIVGVTTPDGSAYTVDAEGNITGVTTPEGISYTVDAQGNVTGVTTAEGVSFTVDGTGNVAIVNPAAGLTFEVDGTGRVMHTELADSATFEVDGDGNVTNVIVQDGVTYTVDGQGNVTSVQTAEGVTYSIDGSGKVTSVTTAEGVRFTAEGGYGVLTAVAVSPDATLPELKLKGTVSEVAVDGSTKFSDARGTGLEALFGKSSKAATEQKAAGVPFLNKITSSDAEAVAQYAQAIREMDGSIASIDRLSKALPGGANSFIEWSDAGTRAADTAAYISTGLQKVADGTITQEDAQGLKDYITDLSEIGAYDPSALDSIAEAFQNMDTVGGTVFEDIDGSGLVDALNQTAGQIDPSAFVSAGQDVVAGLTNSMDAGVGEVQASGAELGTASVEGVADGAQTHSPSAATMEVGQGVVEGLAQGMANLSAVQAAGAAAGRAAIDAVRSSAGGGALYSVGLQIMSGLASGIRSGTSGVVTAMRAAVQAAVAAAKASLQINSPSKVFENEVGAMAMKGFGAGILDETRNQARIIENAARYLADRAQVAVAGGGSSRNTYNTQSSVRFSGSTFIVRNDRDVRDIAQGIAELTNKTQRGTGGLAARRAK